MRDANEFYSFVIVFFFFVFNGVSVAMNNTDNDGIAKKMMCFVAYVTATYNHALINHEGEQVRAIIKSPLFAESNVYNRCSFVR